MQHTCAMEAYGDALRRFVPIDPEGELVNRVVAFVEERSDVLRVAHETATAEQVNVAAASAEGL